MNWKQVEVGKAYTKKILAEILGETTLPPVREGVFTCRQSEDYILFVNLDKASAKPEHKFNDFFNGAYFEWDSQPRQHIETKAISDVVNGIRRVHLMARVHPKIKSKSQPFIYCGQLAYDSFDPNTTRPVHITFKALDYRINLSENHPLQELYDWTPGHAGRESVYLVAEPGPTWHRESPSAPEETERTSEVKLRVGQKWFRDELFKRWKGTCPVTGCDVPTVLRASHIVPWSESESERLNVNNGILLAAHVDALFDGHLISFSDDGKMVRSQSLRPEQLVALGIPLDTSIAVSPGMKPLLRRHRMKLK